MVRDKCEFPKSLASLTHIILNFTQLKLYHPFFHQLKHKFLIGYSIKEMIVLLISEIFLFLHIFN